MLYVPVYRPNNFGGVTIFTKYDLTDHLQGLIYSLPSMNILPDTKPPPWTVDMTSYVASDQRSVDLANPHEDSTHLNYFHRKRED